MAQDFRPEDIATVQRALVSVDFVLLLAACLLSLFALPRLALFAATLRARIPLRARTLALSFALAVALFGASALCFRWLSAEQFPTQTAETLTLPFAERPAVAASDTAATRPAA